MKILNNIVIFATVLTLLSFVSPAQEKSGDKKGKIPAPVEVKANVMLLDAANAYVNNLKPEDIKIFEDDVEQKITSVARRELKLDVVLLLDNSGSLRTELKRITNAAANVVVNLGPKDEVSIVRFVSSDKIEVIAEWTSDQTKLLTSMKDGLYIEGGASAVVDAVYLATGKLKERKGPAGKAILMVSDGEDRSSYYSRKDLFKLLEGTDIQIYTVALTANLKFIHSANKEQSEEFAKSLALATGGATYVVDRKLDEGIAEALRSILIELRSQYVVAYTSSNRKRGTTRKLRIEVADGANGEKRKALMRDSVYVPKDFQ